MLKIARLVSIAILLTALAGCALPSDRETLHVFLHGE
jgi:hypothetical protein